MGLGKGMHQTFTFPQSFAACVVVRLTALYFFSSVNVWLGSSFLWVDQGSRGKAGRGEIVDFVKRASRLQCLSRQWLGCGHCSLSEGKGAKCLSIITGSVLSQDTAPPPPPPSSTPHMELLLECNRDKARTESVADIFWNCLKALLVSRSWQKEDFSCWIVWKKSTFWQIITFHHSVRYRWEDWHQYQGKIDAELELACIKKSRQAGTTVELLLYAKTDQ